jgi:alanine-synthesizing transaminase
MFSRRSRFERSPNALAVATARRRASGGDLLDLTESNPTRVGLGFPREALLAALADARAATYEPDPLGLPGAREAIAGYYADRGVRVAPERIVVTASTSEAYSLLFKLLADPGDEVLVPVPSYPLFDLLATLDAVRAAPYPLAWDGEWHLDRAALAGAIGPRTRALVAVSPNNPTGSFLKADELALLAGLCQERGLPLVCDEVFADYSFAPDLRRAPSALARGEALAFALGGLSKVAALPQLKVGWLAAAGPAPLVEEAMARLEIAADTYLSPSTPSQLAVPRVLARRALGQDPLRARLAENLAALRALRPAEAPWQTLPVEGGWSAILQVPRVHTEEEWACALVEEDGVLVHPGFFFDFPREGFLALSLIVEPPLFREAIRRLSGRLA